MKCLTKLLYIYIILNKPVFTNNIYVTRNNNEFEDKVISFWNAWLRSCNTSFWRIAFTNKNYNYVEQETMNEFEDNLV